MKREDTYLECDEDGIAYPFESDVPYTGVYVTYHENGSKKEECWYENGREHGKYRLWYEAKSIGGNVIPLIGPLELEGFYKDDGFHGEQRRYHENGKLQSARVFKNGACSTRYRIYDENGKRYGEGYFDTDEGCFIAEEDPSPAEKVAEKAIGGALWTIEAALKVTEKTFLAMEATIDMADKILDWRGTKTVFLSFLGVVFMFKALRWIIDSGAIIG